MLSKERQSEIDSQIETITQKTGLTYPKANLLDIAEKLNVKVFYTDFSEFGEDSNNINGLIKWNGEDSTEKTVAKIYLNKDYAPTRQRFTLAHEIGHFILHQGKDKLRIDLFSYSNNEESAEETEANYFAGSLLMPKMEFKKVFQASEGDLDLIAKYFGVSTKAAEVRLQWILKN